ncbi:MAG: hypothetical protein ABSB86_16655, partial [Bryobacteraceae bacterium]
MLVPDIVLNCTNNTASAVMTNFSLIPNAAITNNSLGTGFDTFAVVGTSPFVIGTNAFQGILGSGSLANSVLYSVPLSPGTNTIDITNVRLDATGLPPGRLVYAVGTDAGIVGTQTFSSSLGTMPFGTV